MNKIIKKSKKSFTSSENTFDIKSFGVGSFQFKVENAEIQKTSAYISNFLDELRKIPGIREVEINLDPMTYKTIVPRNNEVHFSFLDIKFYIDLSSGNFSKKGQNKFLFVSRSEYDSIVTLIFPLFKTQSPSTSIFRVREHIREFLTEDYQLDVVGPSPFHADFFITKANKFSVELDKRHGYDKIYLNVESDKNIDIIDEIYREVAKEFNLYYMIKEIEVRRIESWEKLENLIMMTLRKISFFSFSIKEQFVFRHNYLTKAMQSLSEFEASSLVYIQSINKRFGHTYDDKKEYLISYIKEAKKSFYEYPIKSTQDFLNFIGDSRGRTQSTVNTYINTFVNVFLVFILTLVLYYLA